MATASKESMSMFMEHLLGPKVVVTPPFSQVINRSLKERLFTKPWKPFRKTKTQLTEALKDGEVIIIKDEYHMNARTKNVFLKAIIKGGES